jgi:hypothetical protein
MHKENIFEPNCFGKLPLSTFLIQQVLQFCLGSSHQFLMHANIFCSNVCKVKKGFLSLTPLHLETAISSRKSIKQELSISLYS